MSLFKMFGTGRSKSEKNTETPRVTPSSGPDASHKRAPAPPPPAVAAEGGQEAMDPDEAEARAAAAQLDLPYRSGKKSRNLSISRSGRHRYRQNKRASVVTGEVFDTGSAQNETGSSAGAASGSTGSGYCRSSADCRDSNKASHGALVQSHTQSRTPTAV